jgi:hypothetical protein
MVLWLTVCRIWVLPVEDLDAVQAAVPGLHEKLTLGLKKTVRASPTALRREQVEASSSWLQM